VVLSSFLTQLLSDAGLAARLAALAPSEITSKAAAADVLAVVEAASKVGGLGLTALR
jgi:hypothetical protein